jgi:hypothetical protein
MRTCFKIRHGITEIADVEGACVIAKKSAVDFERWTHW